MNDESIAASLSLLSNLRFGLLVTGQVLICLGTSHQDDVSSLPASLGKCLSWATVVWCCTGYAVGYGNGSFFLGMDYYFMSFPHEPTTRFFLRGLALGVAGSMAIAHAATPKLTRSGVMRMFFMYCMLYPLTCCWVWSKDGWLSGKYTDASGGSVYHLTTGVVICVISLQEGYSNRWDPLEKSFTLTKVACVGKVVFWIALSTYAASHTTVSSSITACVCITVTVCSAITTELFMSKLSLQYYDPLGMTDTLLFSVAAVASSSSTSTPIASCILGCISAILCRTLSFFWGRLQNNDTANAAVYHGGGGLLGAIYAGFVTSQSGGRGVISGDAGSLGVQLMGVLFISCFSAFAVALTLVTTSLPPSRLDFPCAIEPILTSNLKTQGGRRFRATTYKVVCVCGFCILLTVWLYLGFFNPTKISGAPALHWRVIPLVIVFGTQQAHIWFMSETIANHIVLTSIGMLLWWIVGFYFETGPGALIGGRYAMLEYPDKATEETLMRYFASLVAMLQGLALLCTLPAQGVFLNLICAVYVAFVYPVASHWCTNDGWLVDYGFVNYSNGHVYIVSGAYMVGFMWKVRAPKTPARMHRRNKDNEHDVFLSKVLYWSSGAIAWSCLLFHNVVSPHSWDFNVVNKTVVNSTVASAAGGLVVLLMVALSEWNAAPNLSWRLLNGMLTGLLACSFGGAYMRPSSSAAAGAIGALIMHASYFLQERYGYQGDVFPIYCAGGIWGCVAAGIFSEAGRSPDAGGIVSGNLDTFGVQCLGGLLLSLWAVYWALFVSYVAVNLLGLDVHSEHSVKRAVYDVTGMGYVTELQTRCCAFIHFERLIAQIEPDVVSFDIDACQKQRHLFSKGVVDEGNKAAFAKLEVLLQSLRTYRMYLPEALVMTSERVSAVPTLRAARDTRVSRAPDGFMAIVFTHVELGETHWLEHKEEMSKANIVHRDIVREQVKVYDGREVKSMGDTFMFAFSDCNSAVEFATTVQLAMVEADWPADLLELAPFAPIRVGRKMLWCGLRLKIGIDYGPVIVEKNILTDKLDYHGSTSNKASRLAHAAIGGLALVSSSVTAACLSAREGSIPIFIDLPDMEFKGVGLVTVAGIIHPSLHDRVDAVRNHYTKVLESTVDVFESEENEEDAMMSMKTNKVEVVVLHVKRCTTTRQEIFEGLMRVVEVCEELLRDTGFLASISGCGVSIAFYQTHEKVDKAIDAIIRVILQLDIAGTSHLGVAAGTATFSHQASGCRSNRPLVGTVIDEALALAHLAGYLRVTCICGDGVFCFPFSYKRSLIQFPPVWMVDILAFFESTPPSLSDWCQACDELPETKQFRMFLENGTSDEVAKAAQFIIDLHETEVYTAQLCLPSTFL